MVVIDGVEYGGVIAEAYSESDWTMWWVINRDDIAPPSHTFSENQIQYNQNEYRKNGCTIYASMWAYSDLTGYEFTLQERKDLYDLAVEQGLDPSFWWYVHKWFDLIRTFKEDVSYARVRIWSDDYRKALKLWFSLVTWYGWNRTYNKDRDDNRIVESNDRWDPSYHHAIRHTLVDDKLNIPDNYLWRGSNVYAFPELEEKQKSWELFARWYFYFKKIDIHMANLPKHITRDQAPDSQTREIIIARENEISAWIEKWGDTNSLYVDYTGPHAITRMLIDLKWVRSIA